MLRTALEWLLRWLGRVAAWPMRVLLGLARLFVQRPAVQSNHAETAWERTRREFHVLGTNTIRFGLWVALWGLGGTGAGILFSKHHHTAATAGITVLAAAVGVALAYALPLIALLITAPVRQRDDAREEVARVRESAAQRLIKERQRFDEAQQSYRESFEAQNTEKESLREQLGQALAQIEILKNGPVDLVVQAARLIDAELVEIEQTLSQYISALEQLPETRGLHYGDDFSLPTRMWETHASTLAADGALFAKVQPAYAEIARLRTIIDWRRTAAKGLIGVNRDEDDLPSVRHAVADAIGALKALIDSPTERATEEAVSRQSELQKIVLIRSEIESGKQIIERAISVSKTVTIIENSNWHWHHLTLAGTDGAMPAYNLAKKAWDGFQHYNDCVRRRSEISDDELNTIAADAARAIDALDVLYADRRGHD